MASEKLGLRAVFSHNGHSHGKTSNFGVDYVIRYRVPVNEWEQALAAHSQLVTVLADVGFATEVRVVDELTPSPVLLLFLRIVSNDLLASQVYQYRVQDWLYGARSTTPETPSKAGNLDSRDDATLFSDEPVSEAERLRLAYLLITKPRSEGGAGVTPGTGKWKYVESIFPLHDTAFNIEWLKSWSTKYFLNTEDLDKIRDRFGEQVAFYFAFLQDYSKFLLFPAAFGFGAWLLLGQYSWVYAVVNCLWSVVFFEHWKMKEIDLAVQWGVRGVSKVQHPRPQYHFDREDLDPITGEMVKTYSPYKRLAFQTLQIPFALACLATVGVVIASCFAVEIFISEVYTGPFKQYLTFLPTILAVTINPTLSALLTKLANKLTQLENYETVDAHQAAFVQKIFVLNFITSYLPIFLTAFVYVPFAKVLVPYLDVFRLTAQKFTQDGKPLPVKKFEIDPDRLTKQVIYFTVTAQIVNFGMELVLPYVQRKVFRTVKEVQSEMTNRQEHQAEKRDDSEEASFLARVKNESELSNYDVTVDYREMVVQFGYLSLCSVVWPLAALSFLINNWVEARGDALKIAVSSKRPIPWRADSIGPWLNSLGFISWLGSVTSAALVFLFRTSRSGPKGSPAGISAWALLLSILFAEHIYLVAQVVVRYVIRKIDSPGLQKERAERLALRKQLLEGEVGHDMSGQTGGPGLSGAEKKTIEALSRRTDMGSAESRFWQQQRSKEDTIESAKQQIQEVVKRQNAKKTGPKSSPVAGHS